MFLLDWAERWANAPGPYRRTVLVGVGFPAFVVAALGLNSLLRLMGFGPRTPTGQPPMEGAVGAGIVALPMVATALGVAGGLVCLGAAVPAGDRRPLLGVPAGAFEPTQRVVLVLSGIAFLVSGFLAVISLLFLTLTLLVGWLVLPLVLFVAYFLVLAGLVVPLDSTERLVSWPVSVVLAGLAYAGVIWLATRAVDVRFFPIQTVAGGLPAITLLAGYVARTPVVTYFSGD